MTRKNDIDTTTINISGIDFDYKTFASLLGSFKEAFSHASLSIEEAFQELEQYEHELRNAMDLHAFDYYYLLDEKQQLDIQTIVKQALVYKACYYGMVPDNFKNDSLFIDKVYQEKFANSASLFPYFLKFDQDGFFDKVATFHNLEKFIFIVSQREIAYKKAYNMQKDNLDAFDYAMKLPHLCLSDVIDINSIVTKSDPNREIGFKKTNNAIIGSSFSTCDKKNVQMELEKLFHDYQENFGMEIKDFRDPNLLNSERNKILYDIFYKEARFHIIFERIHPFHDGNGRTGRILMNHHLLKQGVAPVLITDVMSDEYKSYINHYDVEGLAKLLQSSSSQQMTNWVSMKKTANVSKRYRKNNAYLAQIEEYQDNPFIKKNNQKP